MEFIFADSNLSQGALVALKMVAGVAIAAVLLYLVLLLSRVLGTKIEQAKYDKYCQKYRAEHDGSEDGMLSKEDFVETRAKGNAVVWRRDTTTTATGQKAPPDDVPADDAQPAPNTTDDKTE